MRFVTNIPPNIKLLFLGSFVLAVLLLATWTAFHPAPGICYGLTLGVPYPYHPIPCGLFPLGH